MRPESRIEDIVTYLNRWDNRRRRIEGLQWATRGLLTGLLVGVLLATIVRFEPLMNNRELAVIVLSLATICLAAGLIIAWLLPRTLIEKARFADRQLNLLERTSTAIEIHEGLLTTDHEMAENVVHLVLARLPDAPGGVGGISLFLVPKFLVNDDGSLGDRNDVYVTSVEHKLGIHASPTCVLNFGDKAGAIGYLVGKENRGLACMFTMMNLARLQVGIQGLSISERSYQASRDYAKERVQGQVLGTHENARIIQHPDVRRMLMTMKSLIEAMRATAYVTASALDVAHHIEDADMRAAALERSALLTPVVKGWMTEVAQELTSIGVQIHGGSGFIEETGVAQHMRDAKILTIYEGTTGIQANDLVGRKVLADSGQGMQRLLQEMVDFDATLASCGPDLDSIRNAVATGHKRLEEATNWLLGKAQGEPAIVYLAAFDYLMLAGTVIGVWQMARAAEVSHKKLAANEDNADFYKAKIITARFYAEEVLPRSAGHVEAITSDGNSAMELPEDQF
jgi:hypothetical protein